MVVERTETVNECSQDLESVLSYALCLLKSYRSLSVLSGIWSRWLYESE